MIVKKLLVPFVNEKILQNAEHCAIACASISEQAFDFLMAKLPPKCKVDIVTGLDRPTDPAVLDKALNQYPNRVTFRIHTKTTFHSNVYIFDLPFRKMIAFVGSPDFTMAGFKENEELSYKIDTEKGVEETKAWFRSCFEYAQELSDEMVSAYQEIYPSLKERELASERDKNEFTAFITGSFRWEKARLGDQYFGEEDFLVFQDHKTSLTTQLVEFQRNQVSDKLSELHAQLASFLKSQLLQPVADNGLLVSSTIPKDHYEDKVRALWLAYSNGKKTENAYGLKLMIRRNDFSICLTSLSAKEGSLTSPFVDVWANESTRKKVYDLLKTLDKDYWIALGVEKLKVALLKNADHLWESIQQAGVLSAPAIGRTFAPDDKLISSANMLHTVQEVVTKLSPLLKELNKEISSENNNPTPDPSPKGRGVRR